MGVGTSRIEPETLHQKRLFAERYASVPPFIVESFWNSRRGIHITVENMSEGPNKEMNGNLRSKTDSTITISTNINTSIEAQGTKCETAFSTGSRCQPDLRRRLIPPPEIQFRENYCGKLLCSSQRPLPLEPDQTHTGNRIILKDSLGELVLPPIRQWQIFPGNNRFFCDGWIITGSDRCIFYCSFFLLNLIYGLFTGIVLPMQEPKDISITLYVIAAVLYFYSATTMLYSALTDPGIIPRATRSEVEASMKQHASKVHPTGVAPFIRERVNGKEIIRRWCPTCLFYKPPRATHCRTCNNCIEKFDHHCPFIGNCVGQRNYPTFFAFLTAILLSAIFVDSVCILVLYENLESSKNLVMTVSKYQIITSIIVTIMSTVSAIPVAILFYMHSGFVCSNVTTNEDIKRSYGSHNPYDQGSKWMNCKSILFSPRIPSMIRRRELITKYVLANLDHFDSLHNTLIKKFGRRPNSNGNISLPGFISQDPPTNEASKGPEVDPNPDAMQRQKKDKSFVFMHHRSEPNLSRYNHFNCNNTKTDYIVELESTQNRLECYVMKELQVNQDNHAKINMEQGLTELHVPPSWDVGYLLTRKKRVVRNSFSEYDLRSGRSCREGWNNNQRIGPSYQRQTP